MTIEPKDQPGKKMRKLLGNSNPLTRLPKKSKINPASPKDHLKTAPPPDPEAGKSAPPSSQSVPAFVKKLFPWNPASFFKLKPDPASKRRRFAFTFGLPLWNIASILSLTINMLLIAGFFTLQGNVNRLSGGIFSMFDSGVGLLGGMYDNFEKMDRAHITTDINVSTTLPVQFDLQLNQLTDVVLSRDVVITNALVTVNTGGLNITRANTTIVLPSGTILPVVLNLTVPVETTVPVTLNVPVDIPLEQTQLHDPFISLQETVKPIYCMLDAEAINLNGEPVCR